MLILLFYSLMNFSVLMANDCGCPRLECDPCSIQEGVTFYTEQCNGGKSVKSCARPTCKLKAECMVKHQGVDNDRTETSQGVRVERHLASVRGNVVGKIIQVEGDGWLKYGLKKEPLKKNMKVHQSDLILTGDKGKAQLKFSDGNILNISAKSELKVKTYIYKKGSHKKRTIINLIKGKVRSKVNQKYKGKENYFRIKTRFANVDAKGTDFVVGYQEGDKAETVVETLSGKVELKSLDDKSKREVAKGEYATYVVDSPPQGVFNDGEISEFVARGYMTPVYKLSGEQVKNLDWETQIGEDKKMLAAVTKESFVCSHPSGKFNDCQWKCVNNPASAKRCRTDLPKVNCVRFRCNANGEWKGMTRLPASFYDSCDAQALRIAPCDY